MVRIRLILIAALVLSMIRATGEPVAAGKTIPAPPFIPPSAFSDSIVIQETPSPDSTPVPGQAVDLFRAVLLRDYSRMEELLAGGVGADAELPAGPPDDFLRILPDARLVYYAQHEQGFTVLMFAAALGDREAVNVLLRHGADRWKKTKRHRTFALWLGAKTGNVGLIRDLMGLEPGGEWSRYEVRVSLSSQTMTLFENGIPLWDSPISSGKKSHPTPTGQFVVTDKYRDWKSSLYEAKMPFFVRLSCSDFGFHAGRLPGYPASHGCIRMPKDKARALFETVPRGALVVIAE